MHTPGPWTIVEYGDGDSLAIHDGDSANRICFMATHGGSQKSWTAIQANAQAITATPDFMEAAAMMTAAEQSGGDMWWRGFNMLKDAYKKAGGQFPSMDDNGSCRKGDQCVCGGDTAQVRASCANWVR